MIWTLKEAEQKFTELINAATKEPQPIAVGDRPLVVVVEAAIFQEFLEWQQHEKSAHSLADKFAELRQICADEDYTLDNPSRQDRHNPFSDTHEFSV